MKITYLGPAGATFSAVAYDELSRLFCVPSTNDRDIELALARTNDEIVPLVLEHGGYGAIAMETKAQGRVDPPINSFIELLRDDARCSLEILGATRMKLNFALMARSGVQIAEISKVVAHSKALGACRNNVKARGWGGRGLK
jgi:prephenate dehydratase